MNGINFSIDGPMMTGTWYNHSTGDRFTVRDTFFENNQLLISTTDGRMMDYNTIQNYVQCDAKDLPRVKDKPQSHFDSIPEEVASILESPTPQDPNILEEDMYLINGHTQTKNTQTPLGNPNKPIVNPEVGLSEDQRLVERILSRQQLPAINCKVKWSKFPQKQMDVLIDMMGISVEDVCDFYISKINLNDIRESIKTEIEQYINTAMVFSREIKSELESISDMPRVEKPSETQEKKPNSPKKTILKKTPKKK